MSGCISTWSDSNDAGISYYMHFRSDQHRSSEGKGEIAQHPCKGLVWMDCEQDNCFTQALTCWSLTYRDESVMTLYLDQRMQPDKDGTIQRFIVQDDTWVMILSQRTAITNKKLTMQPLTRPFLSEPVFYPFSTDQLAGRGTHWDIYKIQCSLCTAVCGYRHLLFKSSTGHRDFKVTEPVSYHHIRELFYLIDLKLSWSS